MDTSTSSILSYIAQGESETVEFKTRLTAEHAIGRVLAGFANTRGGVLLIGIGDRADIVGVPEHELAPTLRRLRRIVESLLPTGAEIGHREIAGRTVVYAAVPPVPSHVGPVLTATGELYQRHGEVTSRLPADQELAFLRSTPNPPASTPRTVVVFVAMSFREEEEPALADYFAAMKRAVEETRLPLRLTRIDLEEGDYEISQRIMDDIDKADVVLCDFTLSPANVYFELGYARGAKKRVVQTARTGTKLEFDIRNFRTLFYRNATQLEQNLVAAFQAAYADVTGQSSVSPAP